jgi:hypothetical protein
MYVHPLERLAGNVGPGLVFIGIVATNGQVSAWTLWSFMLFRQLHFRAAGRRPLRDRIPAIEVITMLRIGLITMTERRTPQAQLMPLRMPCP